MKATTRTRIPTSDELIARSWCSNFVASFFFDCLSIFL